MGSPRILQRRLGLQHGHRVWGMLFQLVTHITGYLTYTALDLLRCFTDRGSREMLTFTGQCGG